MLSIYPLHLGTITRAIERFCSASDQTVVADPLVIAWEIAAVSTVKSPGREKTRDSGNHEFCREDGQQY